jgi:DNA-binding response OmpR family regulator
VYITVVVVALALPDYKGYDICQKIKSMNGLKTKVILITGKLKTVEPSWAKNSGADEVLVKSSTYESLCQAVVRLI